MTATPDNMNRADVIGENDPYTYEGRPIWADEPGAPELTGGCGPSQSYLADKDKSAMSITLDHAAKAFVPAPDSAADRCPAHDQTLPCGHYACRPQAAPEPDDDEGRFPHAEGEPLDRLPETFWGATPVLRQIRQIGHARRVSPDATLHATLARIASLCGPTVRVDGEIKRPLTLCWYCGLYGPPGAGKGGAEDAAEELAPFPNDVFNDLALIDISTGQGVIDAYLGFEDDPTDEDGKRKIKVQKKARGYVLATEGSVLNDMAQMKSGGTLNGVFCKAWFGERQGTTNATVELKRELIKGSYTLSMSLGVQEEPAAKLLEMGNIGLPQRLAWAWATLGPDTPDVRPSVPDALVVTGPDGKELPLSHWVASLRDVDMKVPARAVREIDDMILSIARGRGEEFPLDTHEPAWRLKCAALMALLHGHTKPLDEHWDMADVMWRVSRRVRDGVQETTKRRMEERAAAVRAEAVRTAVESQTATFEALHGENPLIVTVAKRAARWLANRPGEHEVKTFRSSVKPSTKENKRYRESGGTDPLWPAAMKYAADQGWIAVLADGSVVSAGAVSPPA